MIMRSFIPHCKLFWSPGIPFDDNNVFWLRWVKYLILDSRKGGFHNKNSLGKHDPQVSLWINTSEYEKVRKKNYRWVSGRRYKTSFVSFRLLFGITLPVTWEETLFSPSHSFTLWAHIPRLPHKWQTNLHLITQGFFIFIFS